MLDIQPSSRSKSVLESHADLGKEETTAMDTEHAESLPKFKSSLDLFSSITIDGLVRQVNDLEPKPVTLSRAKTFPARLCRGSITKSWQWGCKMGPLRRPKRALHLRLRVKETLGEGRVGAVLSTEVVAISSEDGRDASNLLADLPKLCIKVSNPTNCHRLAREAWFYERLHLYRRQNVAVTRSYGFYEANPQQHGLEIGGWTEGLDKWHSKEQESLEDASDDTIYADDNKLSHASSPWHGWKASKTDPKLAILLLEQQGAPLREDEYEKEADDIADVLEDLSLCWIRQNDVRYNNMVRSSPSTTICPRHQRVHRWCVIDFEMAIIHTKIWNLVNAQRHEMEDWHEGGKYVDAEDDDDD